MCYLNNICFVCLSNKDNLIAVYHKDTDNEIFIQVKYALPELILNPEIPVLHICSSCYTTLRSFFMFKKQCLENYSRWNEYINTLQGSNDILGQSFSEQHIRVNNCVPLVQHENDIQLNVEENEVALQHDQKTEVEHNAKIKEECLASEDSTDQAFYQQLVKSASVSDDEQDGGLIVTSEDNNALDKDEHNSNTNIDSQNFQCSMCSKVFTDRLTFDNHLRIHINNLTGLECLICNKKISNKYNMKRHMKFHLGIKDFECVICSKKFADSTDLNKHAKIHESIKDYECTICKKKFSQSGYLKIHMKIHADIKDYECSICEKKFSQSGNLKIHMKTHTGIKDYECFICYKKFVRKENLIKHADIHLND